MGADSNGASKQFEPFSGFPDIHGYCNYTEAYEAERLHHGSIDGPLVLHASRLELSLTSWCLRPCKERDA